MEQQLYRNVHASKVLKALLILVPAVFFLMYTLLPKLPSSPMLREAFWANKVNKVDQYDIVFVGDSRVYRGIDPEIIQSITGWKGFNLGFSSADIDSTLIQLAIGKLNPNGQKIIVLGVSVNGILDRPEDQSNEHLKSIYKWSDNDRYIKQAIYPYLTIFDHRSISDLYKFAKGNQYYEDYHIQTGFASSFKIPVDSNEALPLYQEEFRTPISLRKLDQLNNQINALIKDNYRVVLVRMPIAMKLYQLEEQKTQLISEFLSTWKSRGIEVITPVGHFSTYDGSHLDSYSAKKVSEQIGFHFVTNFRF